MKFKINLFLSIFVYTAVSMSSTCVFGADNTECLGAGIYEYCGVGSSCKSCPENCYCPEVKSREVKCTGWTGFVCKYDSDEGRVKIKSNSGYGIDAGDYGIFPCPSEYPYSEAKAGSTGECYKKCDDGTKIFNKKVTCKAGEYIPTGSNSCETCPDDSICVGVKNYLPVCGGSTEDKGKTQCDKGKRPNDNKTACVDATGGCGGDFEVKSIQVPAGYYLPTCATTYKKCSDDIICKNVERSVCPGTNNPLWAQIPDYKDLAQQGSWKTLEANQAAVGCVSCPSGWYPNEDKTNCIKCKDGEKVNEEGNGCTAEEYTVAPGYYLPKNSTTQVACTQAKKFCPGGKFTKKSEAQGMFDCPYLSESNKDHTGCELELTKDQMRYGVYGSKSNIATQCWLKTDVNDFKTCVYGGKFENQDGNKE